MSAVALLGSFAAAEARSLGGGSPGAAPTSAVDIAAQAALAQARQSSGTGRQAQESMIRAARALDSMRAAQEAARAAAQAGQSSVVPNGLAPGGLNPAVTFNRNGGAPSDPTLWNGAGAPEQTVVGGRTQVEIKQTESKAILNWNRFDVGEKTDLYFNQTAGGADKANWIALNRVNDPSLAPSRILGTIRADGQVYVINKNGIVFGGGSQVNVNSFVASSLSLSDEQFRAGINAQLKIFDDPSGSSIAKPQFGYLGQQNPVSWLGFDDPAQVPGAVIGAPPGDVRIEAGARLTMANGGKALVFAPHVINNGRIAAPDGQVIMAAGEQVYLSNDLTGVRGLDVAVSAPMRWMFDYYHMMTATGQEAYVYPGDGQPGGYVNLFLKGLVDVVFPEMVARGASVGYSVVNNGMVQANHGNITLMSRAVTQNGALEASTALNNRDGSIRLRAWGDGMMSYGSSMPEGSPLRYWSTGTLTLGSGSVTTSMPDLTDTSEIEQTSLPTRYNPGRIEMRGNLIDIEAQANVIVPAGKISIVASTSTLAGDAPISGEKSIRDGSRVYIGEDAFLSVGGLQDVLLTMESNVVTGEFRINELRDSPLYRDSWLRGKTVSVDKRVSGLFSDGPMAGVNWIEGSPGAWEGTPLGDFSGWIGVGKTTLGELSTKAGSINIKSSGSIITRAGSLLDVSGGSVRYADGWITTSRILGADGRMYDIGAATPDRLYVGFAGSFTRTHNVQGRIDERLNETWSSIFDRNVSRRFERGYTEGRQAGSIQLFAAEAYVLGGAYWGGVITGERQVGSGDQAEGGELKLGGGGDQDRQWLIGDLIVADRPKLLPANFTSTSVLDTAWYSGSAGDLLSFRKKTTYLDSAVLAGSGMGSIAINVSAGFALAKGEKLELAPATNLFIHANVGNDNPATFAIDGSIRIAGGHVTLTGAENAFYGASAVIDVSGEWANRPLGTTPPVIDGGTILVTGEFAPGATLDVSGGGWYDTGTIKHGAKFGDAGAISMIVADATQLAGLDLRGYAAGSGGSISIETTGAVQIGGVAPSNPSVLRLSETLYSERGFRSLGLVTTGDITVADGATISQIPVSVDIAGVDVSGFASGTPITAMGPLRALLLADRVDHKPTSLGLTGSSVTIGNGAVLRTDVGGAVTLTAVGHRDADTGELVFGDVVVNGTIDAPAGAISLSSANRKVALSGSAQLLAQGAAVLRTEARGLRTGKVLDGGSVTVTANSIEIASNALIDVSGTSATIDLVGQRGTTPTLDLASNGGLISIEANDASIAGVLRGHAGGAGATGGRIVINVAGGGDAPRATLQNILAWYTPDCMNLGICNGDWTGAIGYDFGPYLGISDVVIFTREMIDALPNSGASSITISKSAGGGSRAVDPRDFGWTDLALDTFRDYGVDVRAIFASAATIGAVNIQPATLQGGGFADLSLKTAGNLVLDGTNLAFGRSITIDAQIASGGAGTARLTAPYISLNTNKAPGAPGSAGSGKLVLTADLIDVTNAAFTGFAETQLVARDLRMGGLLIDLKALRSSALSADGRLELKVGQVYPATGILASIKAGTELVVEPNGDSGLPFSAAGTLTLEAPVILQNGVVRAPFGSIVLKASDSITLGAGSVTSVSGDGLILPYGTLINNEFWADPLIRRDENLPAPTLSKLPEKNIVLEAPGVRLAAGSVVDIRGGGDLYAWEHVTGPGGSHDVLAQSGVYAVMPSISANAIAQQRVWLAGGNGLAAGWYALLPARYALLPGAFAISAVKGSSGYVMPNSTTLPDGATLMGGYRADAYGSGYEQAKSSWRVMSGVTLRSYSEYNEAFANTYFASDALKLSQYRVSGVDIVTPMLPRDGGSVVFKATASLVLDGRLQSQPAAGGRGGLVDIAGSKIAIVGSGQDRSDLSDYLVVDATSLSNFGAGSLLIGGVRSGDARGLLIDVTASDVLIRNSGATALTGSEILFAAGGTIAVDDGSVIIAQGEAPGSSGNLVMKPQVKAVTGDPGGNDGNPNNDVELVPSKDFGALVRVSTGDAVRVIRENVDTTIGGIVTIGASATLSGGNALLIDATQNTVVAGSASLSGAALSLASGRIGFGGGSSGLILDAGSLAQLANTQALTLRSYSTIDFHTSVDLGSAGLNTVTFDAAGLVGYGTGVIAVTGHSIALDNSVGVPGAIAATGHAQLVLNADEIVLGSGSKMLRGFDRVTLNASREIVGVGNGAIDGGTAGIILTAPVVTGRGGTAQSVTTLGAIRIAANGAGSAENADASLGTRLTLTGASIDLSGRIVALGGAVNLSATNGNVTIGAGGLINVGGFRKQFFDVAQFADAGSIALSAVGSVVLAAGSTLNLAAHADGGGSGKLSMTASNGGTVVLDGRIAAQARSGERGGSFALDLAALPNFAGLSQQLNEAGFSASRQFRIRSGDVVIDGATTVADFSLTADQGAVTLAGSIDARSEYGGNIAITAGNGLTMLGSAQLLAGATGELGSGRVTLDVSGGRLDVRGGTVDVAGGSGGRVRFRALQATGSDHIAVDYLAATVIGARSAVLEGLWRPDTPITVIDTVLRDQANAAADDFMTHAGDITSRLQLGGGIAIASGIEIRSDSDLTLGVDWDLSGRASHEGSLTLRAAGNLVILGHLSDGFSAADRTGVLQDSASWNLRLVSGADLTSASATALTPLAALAPGSGSLIVGDAMTGKVIRTGTGDIDVLVGRDLTLAHRESVIYTAGRADQTLFADFTAPTNASYGIDGGHLKIAAQGSASSVVPDKTLQQDQLFVEWLKKVGHTDTNYVFESGRQSSWWVDHSMFRQGVGALGGGNVSVSTGGDLVNMLVAMPTNGRVRGGLSIGEDKVLEMRNGGLMNVDAGGAVRAGYYYAGRGAGTISAGEFSVGRTVSIISRSGTTDYNIAPVIALGDVAMKIRTAGDLRLQTVMDPLLLNSDSSWFGGGNKYSAYMSGYTDRTTLDLVAIGGNVTLVNQGRFLSKSIDISSFSSDVNTDYALIGLNATNLYPSMTRISALNGSVSNLSRFFTAPGSRPELQLLAETDVTLGEIIMSRATRDMMPSVFRPVGGYGGADIQLYINLSSVDNDFQSPTDSGFHGAMMNTMTTEYPVGSYSHASYIESVRNPDRLINEDDPEPSRIFARSGSISGANFAAGGTPRIGRVVTNEQTLFRAGTDIRNINYNLRNVNRSDVSLLEAGNDIIGGSIDIQGPGAISLAAGRDVYGSTFEIYSRGNYNTYIDNRPVDLSEVRGLPRDGAAISVMAGLKGKQPSYDALMAAYLDPANLAAMPDYLKATDGKVVLPIYLINGIDIRSGTRIKIQRGLQLFVAEMTGELLPPLDAWNRFQSLPRLTQERYLREIYIHELEAAGDNQVTLGADGQPINGGYERGYKAIQALFPGQDWRGDIKIGNATFRTMAGGNIETLTPGGGLQVAALGTDVKAGPGLVTLGYGDINIFARDNVTVNRSRILTFAGGDEVIWSTLGDIDAGRGAKTARSPSAPTITTDVDAVTKVEETPDMSGSGIGTIIGFAGVEEGDVSLIAPKGTVNAGDAGIRVSGNFTVAAMFTLNMDNVKVGGETKGVAKSEPPVVNLKPEVKDKAAADAVKDATQQTSTERPSVIIVEVLGYGGGAHDDQQREEDRRRKRNDQRTYNRNSGIQLVGHGSLTDTQRQALTSEEIAALAEH